MKKNNNIKMNDNKYLINYNPISSEEKSKNKTRIYIDNTENNSTMILRKNIEMKNEWKSNDINLNTLNKLRNFGCNCECHRICRCNKEKNKNILNKQIPFKNNNLLNKQNLLRSQSTLLNREIPYSTSNNRNLKTYSINSINNKDMKELLKKGLTYALKNVRKNNKNENSIKRIDLNMVSGTNHYKNKVIDEKDGGISMKSTMKSTGIFKNTKDSFKDNIDYNNEFKGNNKNNNNKFKSKSIDNNYFDYNNDFDYYNNTKNDNNYSNLSNNNNKQLTYFINNNNNINDENTFKDNKENNFSEITSILNQNNNYYENNL